MRRVVLVVAVPLLVASVSFANNVLEMEYVFPVIAKASGVAGTQWLTEVCIVNPSNRALVITFTGYKDKDIDSVTFEFDPGGSHCWQDAVGDIFLATGLMGLAIYADPNENPGVTDLRFAASVKIYNNSSSGTYGQEIPPSSPRSNWALLSNGDIAVIPGIQHFGVAGESGYRTNIGILNLSHSTNDVGVRVYSNGGNLWATELSVGPLTITQFAIPSTVSVHDGVVIVGVLGSARVIAYASIVDNRTGDGSLRSTYVDAGPAQ